MLIWEQIEALWDAAKRIAYSINEFCYRILQAALQ